jgi:hypothetical protein
MKQKRLTGTITVRLRSQSLRVLRDRARKTGKTPSELVRTVMEREFSEPEAEPTLYERTKNLIGTVRGVAIGPARDARKLLKRAITDRRG